MEPETSLLCSLVLIQSQINAFHIFVTVLKGIPNQALCISASGVKIIELYLKTKLFT
jgi:hypothetical protein